MRQPRQLAQKQGALHVLTRPVVFTRPPGFPLGECTADMLALRWIFISFHGAPMPAIAPPIPDVRARHT